MANMLAKDDDTGGLWLKNTIRVTHFFSHLKHVNAQHPEQWASAKAKKNRNRSILCHLALLVFRITALIISVKASCICAFLSGETECSVLPSCTDINRQDTEKMSNVCLTNCNTDKWELDLFTDCFSSSEKHVVKDVLIKLRPLGGRPLN